MVGVSDYKVYAVNVANFITGVSEENTEVEPIFVVAEGVEAVAKALEGDGALITNLMLSLSSREDGALFLNVNVIVDNAAIIRGGDLNIYFTDEDYGTIIVSDKPPAYPTDTYKIILEKKVDLFIPIGAEKLLEGFDNKSKID